MIGISTIDNRTTTIEYRKYYNQPSQWLSLLGFSGLCPNPTANLAESAIFGRPWPRSGSAPKGIPPSTGIKIIP
jgi:hypothetical protein